MVLTEQDKLTILRALIDSLQGDLKAGDSQQAAKKADLAHYFAYDYNPEDYRTP